MATRWRNHPVMQEHARRARRVLLFFLFLIIMEDTVDLLNSGAFVWGGEEYAVHARPGANPTRLSPGEVRDPNRATLTVTRAAMVPNVERRCDVISSPRSAPRARSHIILSSEDCSSAVPL